MGRFRNRYNRLQNLRDDLIGISFGVGTAIFQITLVTVLE